MKLVLATPLYPPDIAGAAPYVKELAKRLSAWHEVTVVAYGSYPEAVEKVRIVAVDKHRPLLPRMIAFFFALKRASKGADAIIVENGASAELPSALLALVSNGHFILHLGDADAAERATKRFSLKVIQKFFTLFTRRVVDDRPLARPEILPFAPPPSFEAYEASWSSHLSLLKEAVHA